MGASLEDRTRSSSLFLDEISFVHEWQRAILGVANAGLLKNSSLILTGSNARDLKESAERLPGRRGKGKDLRLYPLSLKELGELDCFRHKTFSELLEIYFHVGGFPRAIGEYVTLGLVTDDTFEIYRNWIIGDAARYKLRQETLKQLLFRIAETMTSRITWPTLIENSPIRSHETALEYVEHLQDAFLCHIHYCYDLDRKGPAILKARKIYFIDPLLYAIAVTWRDGTINVFEWMKKTLQDPQVRGNFLESLVINHVARLYPQIFFWYSAKEKKEVDLLIPQAKDFYLGEVKLTNGSSFTALNRSVEIINRENLEKFFESLGLILRRHMKAEEASLI